MDIYSLCSHLPLNQNRIAEIETVLSLKASADENDLILRMNVLDEFITSVLKEKVEKQDINRPDEKMLATTNQLFRKLISK